MSVTRTEDNSQKRVESVNVLECEQNRRMGGALISGPMKFPREDNQEEEKLEEYVE